MAEAVYARVLDGEHLWLAVRTHASELLLRLDREEIAVPTEISEDGDGPLLTARFPLARAVADRTDDQLRLTLHARNGGKAIPVAPPPADDEANPTLAAPATRDGGWQFRVHSADHVLEIVRVRMDRGLPLLAVSVVDEGITLRIPATGGAVLDVLDGETVLASVPLSADGAERVALIPGTLTLAPDATATLAVSGVPVVRAANVMRRPNQAVALPRLSEAVDVRWLPGGRLALKGDAG